MWIHCIMHVVQIRRARSHMKYGAFTFTLNSIYTSSACKSLEGKAGAVAARTYMVQWQCAEVARVGVWQFVRGQLPMMSCWRSYASWRRVWWALRQQRCSYCAIWPFSPRSCVFVRAACVEYVSQWLSHMSPNTRYHTVHVIVQNAPHAGDKHIHRQPPSRRGSLGASKASRHSITIKEDAKAPQPACSVGLAFPSLSP